MAEKDETLWSHWIAQSFAGHGILNGYIHESWYRQLQNEFPFDGECQYAFRVQHFQINPNAMVAALFRIGCSQFHSGFTMCPLPETSSSPDHPMILREMCKARERKCIFRTLGSTAMSNSCFRVDAVSFHLIRFKHKPASSSHSVLLALSWSPWGETRRRPSTWLGVKREDLFGMSSIEALCSCLVRLTFFPVWFP